MSRFLTKVNELLKTPATKSDREKQETQDTITRTKDRVNKGSKDPLDAQLVKKDQEAVKKALKKLSEPAKLAGEAEGDVPVPGPEVPSPLSPTDPGAAPAEPTPLTTEGESFLVNLARKALFVDLDNTSLTDEERETITQDVQPENAKQVARILRKIVVDYGLAEGYDSRIDSLIEDLKKNDRVVVLVPGSFKPPHKGHYEMVRQYSETYPQGQVHVLISAPSAKSERRTKNGKLITPAAAKQIFELYVQPLNNVTVSVSDFPSPVTAAYESLKTLEPGTTVALGASKKDNDWKRWSHTQPWAEKEGLGLNILDPAETAVNVTTDASGRPYSAGNIRDNFDNFELIQQDIPDHVNPDAIKQVFDSL